MSGRMKSMGLVLGAFALWAGAAVAWAAPDDQLPERMTIEPNQEAVARLDRSEGVGISGLTRGAGGAFWAVAEEGDWMVRIKGDKVDWFPMEGVPEGLEPESIAEYKPNVFVLGTESADADRTKDLLLFARFDGSKVTIDSEPAYIIDYASHPKMNPEANRGTEGLCVVDGVVVAALERELDIAGRLVAPMVRFDPKRAKPSWFHIQLSSVVGRIAALSCESTSKGVRVFALERHFNARRLISFVIPDKAYGPYVPVATIAPQIERDFNVGPDLEDWFNPEGLVVDKKATYMINDNSFHGRRSDTVLTSWPTASKK